MAATQGFTDLTARIVSPGAIQWDTSGEMTLTDIYAVTLPGPRDINASGNPVTPAGDDSLRKWRPVGWNVYQPGTGAGTPPVIIARKNVNNIPERNSGHPNYPFMKAVNIDWSQPDNASNIWLCTVKYRYSPNNTDTTSQPDPDDPAELTKLVDVEFYSTNITVPLSYVQSGTPLCTTAGEPITPEPTIDIASPCLRIIMRNKVSPTKYGSYMGTLNASQIIICGITYPAYCARLTFGSRVTEVVVGGTESDPRTQEVYEHTFTIEGNLTPSPVGGYAGWTRFIPNAGYSFLDSNNRLTRAQIQSESDPTVFVDSPLPVALDNYGHRKTTAGFDYIQVFPAAPTNWAGLGFPTYW